MARRIAFHLVASLVATTPAVAQQASPPPEPASHPAEVSLVEEQPFGSVYRQASNSLRLYTHDADPLGVSTCNDTCSAAWPPLRAPSNAPPVGQWTVIRRSDSTTQWAYGGKPVYTRFHDAPDEATGIGIPGWRVMPYMSRLASEISRAQALAATAAMWDVLDANHDGVINVGDRDVQGD